MGEATQPGWTRLLTPQGRFEYQFQGKMPTVRRGKFENATDFRFLALEEEGILYKLPVKLPAQASAALQQESAQLLIAETQLRAKLQHYHPRQGAPYEEFDANFALDFARRHTCIPISLRK